MPWRRPFAALAALGVAASIGVALPATAADADQPVRLTIAVPLTAPALETGLIAAEALEEWTSPQGRLTRQLEAVLGRPVAIGIDPMIIASIRVLGTSAPPSAVAWLDRLAAAPNQVFPLSYGDTDLTLATQAGAATIPQPISFPGLDPALFPADPPGPGEPTPSPTPTDAPAGGVPTLEELLAWPYSVESLAWPREDTVVAADLPALEASGYDDVILTSTNVARDASSSPTAQVEGMTALVSDRAVSDALSAAAAATDDAAWESAMAAVHSALASAAAVQPGDRATVFATIQRTAPVVGSRLAETLDALTASASVTSIPLSMALGTPPAPATIIEQPQAADRVAQTQQLLATDSAERRFARVAANPDAITGPRRLELLGLLSAEWAANPTGWSDAVGAFLKASRDLLDAVRVEETSQVNFFAEKSVIPVPVTNDLPEPVTVYVTIDPNTPLLAVEESRVEVVVPPNSQASAQVPVQAISNGRVTLIVELSSADGVQIGPTRLVQVNVVAGWEGPVFTILAVLVVAMFAFGIVRTIVRRRRPPAAGADADD